MKIIVGLGNPGTRYENTPHNIGFRALNAIKTRLESEQGFEYIGSERNQSYLLDEFWRSDENGGREQIILLKPQLFMNESGRALKEYLRYHGGQGQDDSARDVWVVHDDGDIQLGQVRVDRNKSAAGHRGVQNIIEHLGAKDFIRFRIGIRPEGSDKKTEQFVLRRPRAADDTTYATILLHICDGVVLALTEGIEKAQIFLNTKKASTKPKQKKEES